MSEQPYLFGDRDGSTYVRNRDRDRLNRQARLVYLAILDDSWHTLPELSRRTGEPEASISARLRDLRKPRFGRHIIERRYAGQGLWEYRYGGLAGDDQTERTFTHPEDLRTCHQRLDGSWWWRDLAWRWNQCHRLHERGAHAEQQQAQG